MSTLRRENDAKQDALVAAFLLRSADVSATVRRGYVVDRIIGDQHPFAVHFDFVMISDHARGGRLTICEVTTGAFAIVSLELRVEALMPCIMTDTMASLLGSSESRKKRRNNAERGRLSKNIDDHGSLLRLETRNPRDEHFNYVTEIRNA